LLIESDPSLQVALRLRHRHILVDEYQDVNRASARLLKAVAGDGKHLWVVGDSRQSIYRFRGASSSNMALFASDYANAASDQLSVNYRSSRQIVSTFLAVAPHMGASAGMLPLALTAERGEGPANPEIRRFDMLEDEAGGLAASIREVETRGVSLRDQAVLCRTNGRLNEIAEALEARGLPVLHLGSLFERDEVRDLLALLSLAIDRLGTGLTRVGAMARYDLSLQDVYLVISRLKEVAERPALTSLSVWATTEGLSKAGAEGFARLARDLEGLSSSLSAWEFLAEYLLDRAELIREMARRESVPDRMRSVAIWQFLNFVREQSPVSSGPRIQRTLDRVRQLVLLAEERDLRQVPAGALHMNAVRLMTVHGSKGLEFEAVHIPGLTAVSFPSSYHPPRCLPPVGMIEGVDGLTVEEEAKESQEHEEQCLFFVALSRARTHLRLYLARLQPNGRNRRSPSVFLDWMPTQDVVEISDPEKMALPGGVGKGNAVRVTHTADSSITDSSLSAYQKCPRRYFYTHVFGLGTARKSTAFLRTHNCLYDLIRWLAEARRGGDTTVEAAEQAFESIWKDRGLQAPCIEADRRAC
jgi:superfamily I DNA/RNA helicase